MTAPTRNSIILQLVPFFSLLFLPPTVVRFGSFSGLGLITREVLDTPRSHPFPARRMGDSGRRVDRPACTTTTA